jgi:hypothetical protein
MAKKTWNNPIDKTVDWGGDPVKTDGLPVSGEMVQKFIKDSLDGKAGIFYYDTANNRYIVFADASTRDEYLDNPTRTDLIIGTFDAPFNYTAEINLATPTYNAVYLGDAGNYIDFTFDVKNKQGASTGENVTVTFTIVRNATKQVVTKTANYGETVRFNVDKLLGEGVNTVMVGIIGQTSLAATTASITYNVVNLQIVDETDITIPYNLANGSKILETGVTVKGSGTKIIEWYLDGQKLKFVKSEDEVVEVEGYRPKHIELINLQQGRHSLQIRAYTMINGEKFYTQTLYRDIMVYTGVDSNIIMAMSMEIPAKYGLASGSPTIYGMTQYIPYPLKFATYSPNNITVQVEVKMDNDILGNVSSQNGIVNEFSILSKTSGNKMISLVGEEVSYDIPAVIAKTAMTIEEITSGLKIDFSAIGRVNKSEYKDVWEQGDYVGTFEGFEWNAGSGWANNRLKINAGASFGINYAPLANNPKSLGRTLEFEFKTLNVNDDNAVICDLRNSSGTGILITATKVSVISENGVVVENEFKSNENVRISIVINRATGSTRKGLTLIYANGSISRGVNWAVDDNYTSDANILFKGSAGAEVELKSIRIYESALSDDNILNNYILYRDSVAEMLEVYDRNDVYVEGTTTFSPNKMVSRLPVMIVTGDIPTLENTSDKDTQIVVDIEYTNMQDTSRSFKMVGAAMRPQGTSSMGYPKKNFRIYTQKVEGTILYDANGAVVSDKLYSFKKDAIPVNCWCLKADYAESSGTHNTGIARMWNNALFNMQIDGEYVCRTDAQKAALAAGYTFDVRTTIDGFPILLFYRKNATDEPIFIGKYNFNNDKSTEKVFGFTDIPGFDNSRMQCWEVLNNGNSIGLFTDISNFYNDVTSEGKTKKGWEFAFESRYPDTKTPNTDDLYNFAVWMNGVNGDHERFATEKWDHFKIYPMAAYYCYLMRHAAADQLVKNAMFTSEDGQKFYYILYDNDTINGLINTGDIEILPTDDRDSKNESGEYKFAGHSSVLWNMLEADSEFMQIVKEVDNALYSAGISYNDCIRTFDEEQADKWVERVYNQDSEYKYIGPYTNKGINNLEMLQGRRDLHRRWWLSKRFSIYDAKFVSGEYKSQAIELKCMNDTPKGQKFSIKAGYPLDYGFGINDVPRKSGVYLAVGESYTFEIAEAPFRGDPIRIYAAPNIAELDLSSMANRLAEVNIAGVYTEELGTRLKKLILGGEGVNNVEVSEISGLKQAKMLTHLDVRGMRGIKSLDLTSQPYFEELKAIGSSIASVSFAKGAPVNRLELPTTMKSLSLEQLPYLNAENLVFENIVGIHTINVKGCPNLANSFDWVMNWYNTKATVDAKCSLIIDNVNWEGVNADDLIKIAKIGTLDLKGKAVLKSITLEQVNALLSIYGENVFDKNTDFYIDAPAAVFVSGRTELLEGESEQYSDIVFGEDVQRISWTLVSGGNSYVTFNTETGLLNVAEGYGNGTIIIRTIIVTAKGTQRVDTTINIKARVYPTQSQTSIAGNIQLESEYETYQLQYSIEMTGLVSAAWSLSGMDGYAIIDSYNDNSCVIKKLQEAALLVSGTLTCVLTKKIGASLFTITKTLEIVNDTIAETDAGICKALYAVGLCANETFITKDEARLVTADDLQPGTSRSTSIFAAYSGQIKSFNGFKYFTSVDKIKDHTFNGYSYMSSIELPNSIEEIGNQGIRNTSLETLVIPASVHVIKELALAYNYKLRTLIIEGNITSLGKKAFYENEQLEVLEFRGNCTFDTLVGETFRGCVMLKRLVIPESVTYIEKSSCFWGCSALEYLYLPALSGKEVDGSPLSALFTNGPRFAYIEVSKNNKYYTSVNGNVYSKSMDTLVYCGGNPENFTIPATVKTIGDSAFYNIDIKSIVIPEGVETIESSGIYLCNNLKELILPSTLSLIKYEGIARLSNLTKITSYAPIAPTCDGNPFGDIPSYYTGRNTYDTGENMLYVPSNAIGYDSGCWLDPLQNSTKCGFTLNKTLPEVELPDIAEIDSGICKALYDAGLCANKSYITKAEAEAITDSNLASVNFSNYKSQIKSFDGFKYFTQVTSIPNQKFNDTSIVSIKLPNSIKTIGYQCFANCKSLESIEFPEVVNDIGYACFIGCSALKNLNLPQGNYNLLYAFCSGCTSLQSITIPDTVTLIDQEAFANCTSLGEINLPEGITEIRQNAFVWCSSLTYITIPDSVTSIGDSAFNGCTSLTSVTLPNSLTSIGNNAFQSCTSLTSITIPEGVTRILTAVFQGCTSLTSVTLPEGITRIETQMFDNCTSLDSITIPDGVTIIETRAFYGCTALTSINIPEGVTRIGSGTFSKCTSLASIICMCAISPTTPSNPFGVDPSYYTGRNTYNTGQNMLYVPKGATGYDSGYWLDPLQNAEKCGFTLSATL